MSRYAISPNGVFFSVQGEGHLRGFQMAFCRLSGCSVGCPMCDTDYSVSERLEAHELGARVEEAMPPGFRDRWVWITGGEPYDRDIDPLIAEFRSRGMSVAVATSGKHRAIRDVDWLSVSYHGGYPLLQRYGHEMKFVDGLNGLDLEEALAAYPDDETDFFYRYVQPLSVGGAEDPESLKRCLRFVEAHPNWSLSRQDHIYWSKP